MAYLAQSFIAGEQPSASKWNGLWNNDASFNDGTGIGINAIQAASLATNAIKLGSTDITASFSITGTTPTQVTGLSVTFTQPAGGRDLLIILSSEYSQTVLDGECFLTVWDGAVNSGPLLASFYAVKRSAGSQQMPFDSWVRRVPAPSAGAHTYNAGIAAGAAAGTAALVANPQTATAQASNLMVLAI